MFEVLKTNIASPLTLSFALGVAARLIRSELSLPREIYAALSIYLLYALGIKGGVELAQSSFAQVIGPAIAAIAIGCITPITTYLVLRKLGRFSVADSAGIAAHYGSVSAVTFLAAQQFTATMGHKAEGFMPTLLTLLESPGIHIALAIGAIQSARLATPAQPSAETPAANPPPAQNPHRPITELLHEVLTARSMILLVGGLFVGLAIGEKGYHSIEPFYEDMFKGALTLFLLEMGIVAGSRLADLKRVGLFLLGFGIIMPILHGILGAGLGAWAGLSVGGCTVLATMAASASYIAAPPAVRMTLPEANPTYYLTASLAITFPFNIVLGIPIYYHVSRLLVPA
jgi:hypothetical protein